MTTVAELPAGFADKVLSAQSTFRSVMDAMARPGSVQHIVATAGTPPAMMCGTAAIALTLFDHDTPIWLDPGMSATSDVAKWLKFHTSAPVIRGFIGPQVFALISDSRRTCQPLDRFAFGSNEYPDRSTTLILQVGSLTQGNYFSNCAAPASTGQLPCGHRSSRMTCSIGLTPMSRCFPRGIDVVLVHDDAIVAIPRTTRLIVKGD